MVSKKLLATVKLCKKRAYIIAFEAKIHPSTLSKILNGIERTKPGDHRVIAVGRVLGLAEDELFEETICERKISPPESDSWR